MSFAVQKNRHLAKTPKEIVAFKPTMCCIFHKIFLKRALLLCILAVAVMTGTGQKLSFNSWNIESGLSRNTVYAIAQDANGFMWIGAGDKLNRFDGKEFRIFKPQVSNDQQTSENDINCLLVDQKNSIWIGNSIGLLTLDNERKQFKEAQFIGSKGRKYVYCIVEDSKSKIWAGTNKGLFYLKDNKNIIFEKLNVNETTSALNGKIRSLFFEDEGILWVGTNGGLVKLMFNPNGSISSTNYKNDSTNANSISSNVITSISSDKYHNLWIATQNQGINLMDRTRGTFIRFKKESPKLSLPNNFVRVIKPDKQGNIWVGTQEGLARINWQTQTISSFTNYVSDKHSLSQNSVHSIFIDKNDQVWVGTFFGGINLISPYNTEFQVWQNNESKKGLSNNIVSSIASGNDGNLWIGTEGGGLNYYNKKTGEFIQYKQGNNSVGSNLIKTIFKDKDGHIWVGTHAGGLNLFENGQFRKYTYASESAGFLSSEISTIAEDVAGNLWLGIQGGIQDLKIYRRAGTTLTDISNYYNLSLIKGRNIKKIFPDSKHNIWIATSTGLYIIKNGSKNIASVNFTANNTSSDKLHIICIQEDSKGNIWLGIENGLLTRFNPTTGKPDSFRFAPTDRGNTIYGILEDANGMLWLSTDLGIIRLNSASGNFQRYTTTDGLPSNTFNYNAYFKANDEMFYFGGYNGVVGFNPLSFFSNNQKATIVFTGLKILDHPDITAINPSRALELYHGQNVFTLQFALLNYINPEKNKYAYFLKGFDKHWIETENPVATYMNLSPGKYTLMIKGANNDGVWSQPAQLSIVIHPPIWRTWWAYTLYFILFATFLFVIIRYFYLQALIKKEEVLHQNKLDFFTNVTHEIRTHLTLIMSPVDKMIQDRAKDHYLQKQFQNIKKSAGNLLRLSEELMDFRKVETQNIKLQIGQYDIVDFVKEVYEQFTELSLHRDMHISFTHDFQSQILYFDKEQLEKVFFNLISNAFKFTPDGGKIGVNITEETPYIKVVVSDNGLGISPEYKDKLFNNFFQINDAQSQNKGYGIGLALSSKIAALHGARIEVDSSVSETTPTERVTTFAVFLQKGFDHFDQSISIPQPQVTVEDSIEKIEKKWDELGKESTLLENYIKEKKLSVLVVDDNQDIGNTIHEILSDKYKVELKENVAEGWQFASEQIPDLIISDVMMPDEDGFSFCNRIKNDIRTCHIPVILLTAKSAQQDHIFGLGTGADLYLTKPFNRRILELNVRNLLATRERIKDNINHIIEDGRLLTTPEVNIQNAGITDPLDSEFLKNILHIIEAHLDDPEFNVTVLAQKAAMSVPVLYKKLKAVANMSVNDFIKSIKLQKAAEMLQQNTMAVYEVCFAVGFTDRKHFSNEFKKKYGLAPKQYSVTYRMN